MANNRISKKEVAASLGGSFVSGSGTVNYKKLETYLCRVLGITEQEYKESNFFTDSQIQTLKDKKIIV